MDTATVQLGHTQSAADVHSIETEPLLSAEAPDISRGARNVIIYLLIGAVILLGTIAAYVFSGLYRYQNI